MTRSSGTTDTHGTDTHGTDTRGVVCCPHTMP